MMSPLSVPGLVQQAQPGHGGIVMKQNYINQWVISLDILRNYILVVVWHQGAGGLASDRTRRKVDAIFAP
jgi:hypothetical protein